jgi:arylsulfatase A-like enzyme
MVTVSVSVCILLSVLTGVAVARQGAAATTKPNIVVFYMDDVNPHDGRLWDDPTRTPTIYDHFIAHGTHFANSIGETPLCCPGRAGFLTGLHSANHGVLHNDAREFNPAEHVGREMKSAGYTSMWIGKYFNQDNLLTEDQWVAHGKGWTYLDAIYGPNGDFHDYTVHTKTGYVAYPTLHSTLMVGERTIQHLRETPATTPVFAVLSVFDTHAPNTPLSQFKDDPRCANMPPWDPPNYNEADVSDKPAFIEALPLLPYPDGWPMRTYCEELLGVDLMMKQVIDELTSDGRIDNTLLVFTADNGMTWGSHRMGQQKLVAYATPVPLYMSWPARWGSKPRTIDDVVSNIDMAPTFCAIGGCVMDNYAFGRHKPDGVNLLPLLDGNVNSAGRDALLETAYSGDRTWTALRTTASNSSGRWHYVEWATGERELYDSIADPWELNNLDGQPGYGKVEAALAARLADLRLEHARATPDGSIAKVATGPFVGEFFATSTASSSQTVRRNVVAGQVYTFTARLHNRAGFADSFRVSATSSGSDKMTVQFLKGANDVTAAVVAGTYTTTTFAMLGQTDFTIRVTVAADAPAGAIKRAVVTFASMTNPARIDVVRAVAEISP